MKNIKKCTIVVTLLWTSVSVYSYVENFSYADEPNWHDKYPGCNGKGQSPINFDRIVTFEQPVSVRVLNITKTSDEATSITLTNTGDALVSKYFPPNQAPNVEVYFWNKIKNKIEEFRLHWGNSSSRGSEHTIDGRQYDAELQFVIYNADFDSIEQAFKYSKKNRDRRSSKVKIFALLLQGVDEGAEFMENFTKYVEQVSEIGQQTSVSPDDMHDLTIYADKFKEAFVYEGSLTYPPCSEPVTWFVSQEILKIPKETLEALRKTKLKDDMKSNIRSLQNAGFNNVVKIKLTE